MLETIRHCISNLPNYTFSDFYQDFVISACNQAIDNRINTDSHRFSSIDNIGVILRGLNKMTEELQTI